MALRLDLVGMIVDNVVVGVYVECLVPLWHVNHVLDMLRGWSLDRGRQGVYGVGAISALPLINF